MYQEGDYFGQTVNRTSRIADHATFRARSSRAGRSPTASTDERIAFDELGPVALKGVSGYDRTSYEPTEREATSLEDAGRTVPRQRRRPTTQAVMPHPIAVHAITTPYQCARSVTIPVVRAARTTCAIA